VETPFYVFPHSTLIWELPVDFAKRPGPHMSGVDIEREGSELFGKKVAGCGIVFKHVFPS